jgi:transaldolase
MTELALAADPVLRNLRVQIFADGANEEQIARLAADPLIRGFTTNPTLMQKSGVRDYKAFAQRVVGLIGGRSISFEVFADEPAEMERQAREIASWGAGIFVKIPVTNTKGVSTGDLVGRLAQDGVQVNVTAVMTLDQVQAIAAQLNPAVPSYVSVFAGRIADTGRDPVPMMAAAVETLKPHPTQELIWASPRELLNIFQADAIGCHVITVTHDLLKKLTLVGKDLAEYSLETVKMFHDDARGAGFTL